jgi:hypothetical protein
MFGWIDANEDMRVCGSWGKASDSVGQRKSRRRYEVAEERIEQKNGRGLVIECVSVKARGVRAVVAYDQNRVLCGARLPKSGCFVNTQLRGQQRMVGDRGGGE